MTEFNEIYANEKIDFITNTSYEMMNLFKELEKLRTPPHDKMEQLSNYYDNVTRAIADYYVYLEKTCTDVTDSYLTHWLKNDHCPSYYYDEIEYFLSGPSE